MDLGLKGKGAAVGGASKGIGKAIALGLAREGCNVAICARNEGGLRAAAEEIAWETGARVVPVVCDMSKIEDVTRFVEEAASTLGRLDVLVNNAGGPPGGKFEQHSDEVWQQAIAQNLLSVTRAVRAALPHLREAGGGRIINVLSVSVKEPLDNLILSNSARLGVVGLAKSLAIELGPDNITVNNVCPGYTLTGRLRELWSARAKAEGRGVEDLIAEQERAVPLRRLNEASDVAALAVFLASDVARNITGTTIQVDGGSTRAVM